MHNDGDTLEDYYKRAHLDETRRKFLDRLKEENPFYPTPFHEVFNL
ncbi:MAG: hypothetical protein WBZ36_23270 [Candidatus Nitrosopolaris sp.]